MNSCTCVPIAWPGLLMKDTWSCLTDLNRPFRCAHTRRGIHMSVWCILTLTCWPALQRVAFLSDYSLTYDPPHGLPVPLWQQAGLSCGHFSSTTPASQCSLASTHRLPNKQTRRSNFMPSSLGGVPVAGLTVYLLTVPHGSLGLFAAKGLESQTVCKKVVILILLALGMKYQFIHG